MAHSGSEAHMSSKGGHEGEQNQQSGPVAELDDPNNPLNWSAVKKWSVLVTACYVTFIVGINVTALTAAVGKTNTTFGISDEHFPNSFWPVTAWNTGAAMAPMVVLPIMEDYGVRPGYLIVYLVFFVFVIPQAVAENLTTFITCRFFAGCCGGILQDAMDGIIADMWAEPTQRSLPVSMYVFALFTGVSIGPVIGGAICEFLNWRWIFYVQLIVYGGSAPLVLSIFRETRYPVVLSHQQRRQRPTLQRLDITKLANLRLDNGSRVETMKKFLKENIIRPFFFLATEPVVFFFTLLSAFSYGLLFLATQSVPQVFGALYDFSEQYAGVIQISIVIGEVLGFLLCACIGGPYFAMVTVKSEQGTGIEHSRLPEVRLHLAIPAFLIGVGGGLFLYGWTSSANITFWAPATGLLLLGLGSTVVMQAIMMYITDAYGHYAASASAAVCFGENLFAAFLPLASQSMYTTLGFHWASSLLAFLALALSFAPIALVWKGTVIRERSPFLKEKMSG